MMCVTISLSLSLQLLSTDCFVYCVFTCILCPPQPSRLNEQLSELMPGLSAKVFRTYNASVTLESELEILPVSAKEADKVSML